MSDVRRGDAMTDRVVLEAMGAGLDERALAMLRDALSAALDRRSTGGMDDEHPDFLHPARTALILIEDARVGDADVLAAALLTDSLRPALGFTPAEAVRHAGDRAAALVAAQPPPQADPDQRREALVVCGDDARRIALAERLDHARHLHFRNASEWRPLHASVTRADLPVAEHWEPALGRRLRRWSDAFARRRLRSP